jgi:type II secretory pathway component PulM
MANAVSEQVSAQTAMLHARFKSLTLREQRIVLAGSVLFVLVLLFAALLPLERRVAGLQQRVSARQADFAWLQSIAPRLASLQAAAASNAGGNGESLVVLADRVARETGISRSLTGSQPSGDGALSVRLEQVPFDALAGWAAELVQHHGVRVVSASIDGGATAGIVSATFVLRSG